jgi:hypothetical protein
MKPNTHLVYSNIHKDTCTDICDHLGKSIKFDYLKKYNHPKNGTYLFVIRELEPNRIYICNDKTKIYNCKSGKERTINHNCLALDLNVICAGDITFINKSVIISNASGHYIPNVDCLNYLNYLLSKLGFSVIDYYEY